MKKLINIIPIGLIAFSILSCNSDNAITEIQVITALNSFFLLWMLKILTATTLLTWLQTIFVFMKRK